MKLFSSIFSLFCKNKSKTRHNTRHKNKTRHNTRHKNKTKRRIRGMKGG